MNGMYGLCTTVVGRTRSYLSCGAMQFLECLQSIHCVRIRKTSGSYVRVKNWTCLSIWKNYKRACRNSSPWHP